MPPASPGVTSSRGDRIPRPEPGQLGRAGAGARRLAGLRRRPLRRRPGVPERRRPLRPAAARRHQRAARRAPAVPHRHRHHLAGPARRADDRPGLLAARARRGPPARRARPAPTSTSSRPTSTTRSTSSARARSTSSSPASARCAGCPTSARWARVVAALLRPGGRLFIREGHPMLWALARPATGRRCWSSSTRTSSAPSRSSGTRAAPTSRPTSSSQHNRHARVEPRPRRDRHRAARRAGFELTMLVEHDSVPWEALPGQMERLRRRRVAAGRPAVAARPHLHAAGGQAPMRRQWAGAALS